MFAQKDQSKVTLLFFFRYRTLSAITPTSSSSVDEGNCHRSSCKNNNKKGSHAFDPASISLSFFFSPSSAVLILRHRLFCFSVFFSPLFHLFQLSNFHTHVCLLIKSITVINFQVKFIFISKHNYKRPTAISLTQQQKTKFFFFSTNDVAHYRALLKHKT